MGLWLLLTALTSSATGFLTTTAPTMGDTTSSAIVSRLDTSAAAIPLADSMQVDFMAAAAPAKLEGNYPLGFSLFYFKPPTCHPSSLSQHNLSTQTITPISHPATT